MIRITVDGVRVDTSVKKQFFSSFGV
nr:hypothetical protein [Bacteroides faecichinchillae]